MTGKTNVEDTSGTSNLTVGTVEGADVGRILTAIKFDDLLTTMNLQAETLNSM